MTFEIFPIFIQGMRNKWENQLIKNTINKQGTGNPKKTENLQKRDFVEECCLKVYRKSIYGITIAA